MDNQKLNISSLDKIKDTLLDINSHFIKKINPELMDNQKLNISSLDKIKNDQLNIDTFYEKNNITQIKEDINNKNIQFIKKINPELMDSTKLNISSVETIKDNLLNIDSLYEKII